jgi:hypothetical protein
VPNHDVATLKVAEVHGIDDGRMVLGLSQTCIGSLCTIAIGFYDDEH